MEGWFGNHRSVKEQMLGLDQALSECKGKRVLDVGCAEGNISLAFHEAGAMVHAFDNNPSFLDKAMDSAKEGMQVEFGDINDLPKWLEPPYDIVLALAVLHKAKDVSRATLAVANLVGSLLVIRLPFGSTGFINAKHFGTTCDLHVELPVLGFSLERTEQGPRGELVQYWRR